MKHCLGLQALPSIQVIEARYKPRMARRVSELSPGGRLASLTAARAAEPGQGTWRMTPGQPDRSQNITRSYIFYILCGLLLHTCPAAWTSPCSGRRSHLSASQSSAHSHRESWVSSYASPAAREQFANWNRDIRETLVLMVSINGCLLEQYKRTSPTLPSVVTFHHREPAKRLLICSLPHRVPPEH